MRAKLAALLARAAARLLGRESKRVVFLNVEGKEGPPGHVLPFACWRNGDWQAEGFRVISWPADDPELPVTLGEPVPERVAVTAGWHCTQPDW